MSYVHISYVLISYTELMCTYISFWRCINLVVLQYVAKRGAKRHVLCCKWPYNGV